MRLEERLNSGFMNAGIRRTSGEFSALTANAPPEANSARLLAFVPGP